MIPVPLLQVLRSRWLACGLLAGASLLVYLTAARLGGSPPPFGDGHSSLSSPQNTVPISRLQTAFAVVPWPQPSAATNLVAPFTTRYFVPPPPTAPPPPATTRKVEVTYQGFYQTADSPKTAIFKLADAFVIARVGQPIVTNWFVADASMQSLLLTNHTGQTNLVPLNVKKEIEVPIAK